ncbi:hypothetical protein FH972_011868 [Carpinus fangiana]|uniref:RNase H type-1 domain-containing protein n=1 Tax=Carpinus fangiana TaxID=176857 RepID=A0A5N6R3L7_9ROSI|nr:hypothetical protein FH972_011868 [Carpinus fangiana]
MVKPPQGFIKVNSDASLDLRRKRMGLGVVARDYARKVVAVLCDLRDASMDSAGAEMMAALKAVVLWSCAFSRGGGG